MTLGAILAAVALTAAAGPTEAGFRVLAIDFRGRGRSRGGAPSGSDEGLRFDVLAAVRYLRKAGAKAVSIVGGSMGGGAAAEASIEAAPGDIDRLVLLAHASIEHPERMRGRKLFITARDDPRADGTPRLVRIMTTPDGKSSILDVNPAQVIWMENMEHSWELLAGQVHLVAMEPKRVR